MPSILTQAETIAALEELLECAKAGFVDVQCMTVANGVWENHADITFRRIMLNLLPSRPSMAIESCDGAVETHPRQ
jgi:hypothetical protein